MIILLDQNYYHIEGNFRGRKLSRISEKYDFRGENFSGLLACAVSKDTTPLNFVEKTFTNSQKKTRNSWNFSPLKVSCYTLISLCLDVHESHTLTPLLPPHLELVMQCLYVVFHTLDELGLVLSDGSTDVSPHKESIVAWEDAEHFIGTLGSSQLVS